MRNFLLIAVFILLLFKNSYGDDVPQKWIACSVDNECIAIKDCCGVWQIVNKEHIDESRQYYKVNCSCLSDYARRPEPLTACINNFCKATGEVKPGKY